jgi:hypothetical protein
VAARFEERERGRMENGEGRAKRLRACGKK